MNIFILDESPVLSAQYQCDVHIRKMTLESAQMLCTFFNNNGINTPYKSTHLNHPCQKWLNESNHNIAWLFEHADALCKEYEYRFGKKHKSEQVIEKLRQYVTGISKNHTDFTLAMDEQFKKPSPVDSYREYYKYKMKLWDERRNNNKNYFIKMVWTKRNSPNFML